MNFYDVIFTIIKKNGENIDDENFVDTYLSYYAAKKAVKNYSKSHKGKFTIITAVSSDYWEGGRRKSL